MQSKIGLAVITATALGVAACAGGGERKEDEKPEAQEAPAQETPAQQAPQQEQGQEGQAQPPEARNLPPPPVRPDREFEASRHLAIVDAGLVTASANARLLDGLADDERTYDASTARTLYDNANRGVREAQDSLRRLQPLARSQDERQALEQVGLRLGRAEATLNRIEGDLQNRGSVAEEAGRLQSDLRAAVSPLRNVAQAMNATVDVVGTG